MINDCNGLFGSIFCYLSLATLTSQSKVSRFPTTVSYHEDPHFPKSGIIIGKASGVGSKAYKSHTTCLEAQEATLISFEFCKSKAYVWGRIAVRHRRRKPQGAEKRTKNQRKSFTGRLPYSCICDCVTPKPNTSLSHLSQYAHGYDPLVAGIL